MFLQHEINRTSLPFLVSSIQSFNMYLWKNYHLCLSKAIKSSSKKIDCDAPLVVVSKSSFLNFLLISHCIIWHWMFWVCFELKYWRKCNKFHVKDIKIFFKFWKAKRAIIKFFAVSSLVLLLLLISALHWKKAITSKLQSVVDDRNLECLRGSLWSFSYKAKWYKLKTYQILRMFRLKYFMP